MNNDLKVNARHKASDETFVWHVHGKNARRVGRDLRDALNESPMFENAKLLREVETEEEVE